MARVRTSERSDQFRGTSLPLTRNFLSGSPIMLSGGMPSISPRRGLACVVQTSRSSTQIPSAVVSINCRYRSRYSCSFSRASRREHAAPETEN